MNERKFDPHNSDPIDLMTPEELINVCYLLCGLSWSHDCQDTLTGCIIETFKEWKCDLRLKPWSDPTKAVTVNLVFWPNEFEISSPSLQKAFVKTGQVLGKWKPDAPNLPKTPENAS